MSYLGSLLAARSGRQGPPDGSAAPPPLRPLLPARFEPLGGLEAAGGLDELTAEVPAPSAAVAVPAAPARVADARSGEPAAAALPVPRPGVPAAPRPRPVEPAGGPTVASPVMRDSPAPRPGTAEAHEAAATRAPGRADDVRRGRPDAAPSPRPRRASDVASVEPAPTTAPVAATHPRASTPAPSRADRSGGRAPAALRPPTGSDPAAPPAARAPGDEVVRVAIGRVELRMPAASPTRPAAPAAPWRPRLSLDDYLRERSR